MIHALRTVVMVSLSLALIGVALAQNQPTQQPGMQRQDNMTRQAGQADPFEQQLRQIAQDPKTASDKTFVLGCSQESLFAAEISRQAQTKAQNPAVKQLAQQIVQDHQQHRQRLEELAKQLNIELPQQLAPAQQQMIQIYASVPSDQYDKWFTAMTQAHQASAVIAYRAVAQIAETQPLKQFAEKELGTLSKRYDQAQAAAVALGLPGGGPDAIPASGRIEGQMRTPGNPNTPQP